MFAVGQAGDHNVDNMQMMITTARRSMSEPIQEFRLWRQFFWIFSEKLEIQGMAAREKEKDRLRGLARAGQKSKKGNKTEQMCSMQKTIVFVS